MSTKQVTVRYTEEGLMMLIFEHNERSDDDSKIDS